MLDIGITNTTVWFAIRIDVKKKKIIKKEEKEEERENYSDQLNVWNVIVKSKSANLNRDQFVIHKCNCNRQGWQLIIIIEYKFRPVSWNELPFVQKSYNVTPAVKVQRSVC